MEKWRDSNKRSNKFYVFDDDSRAIRRNTGTQIRDMNIRAELCEISRESRDVLSINRPAVIILWKCPIFLPVTCVGVEL